MALPKLVAALAFALTATDASEFLSYKADYQAAGCCASNGTASKVQLSSVDGAARTCADTADVANGHCETMFGYALMSGEPSNETVVLTTLVDGATAVERGVTSVTLEVFSEETATASSRILSRTVAVDPTFESVKTFVEGLQPDTHYWYRFSSADDKSALARTRTLPNDASEIRMVSMSCSNLYIGGLGPYCKAAVEASDAHFGVHLGDFVYEFGTEVLGNLSIWQNAYPSFDGVVRMEPPNGMGHQPGYLITARERRDRMGVYLQDPCAKALFQTMPFFFVQDDHDAVNDHAAPDEINPFNDNERYEGWHMTELHGDYETRVLVQNMATRTVLPVRSAGKLYPTEQEALTEPWVIRDVGLMRMVFPESRMFRVGQLYDTKDIDDDYFRSLSASEAIPELVAHDRTFEPIKEDPARSMFGAEQLAIIEGELASTPADEWFFLFNSVALSFRVDHEVLDALGTLVILQIADIPTTMLAAVPYLTEVMTGMPWNRSIQETDGCGGYRAECRHLHTLLNARQKTHVVSGDMHQLTFWNATGDAQVNEVTVPSISMPSDAMEFGAVLDLLPALGLLVPGLNASRTGKELFADVYDTIAEGTHYSDYWNNGFVVSTVTPEKVSHTAHLAFIWDLENDYFPIADDKRVWTTVTQEYAA